jgi:hypothetical protein
MVHVGSHAKRGAFQSGRAIVGIEGGPHSTESVVVVLGLEGRRG